ncbi:MAG: hypothetical protein QHJ34_15440 [bacterium]|nr:hypothetical protein [candidate division KSB1 bacterium]MDH7561596.1 hypothetical protein [bacterium]
MEALGGAAEPMPRQIQAKVTGYGGYTSRAERRSSDQLLRAHLISRLEGLASRLNGAAEQAQSLGAPELSEPLSRLHRKLSTICEGLHAPSYLESSFFESTSLPAELLESIYGCELALLGEVSELDEEVSDLDVTVLSEAELQELALRMSDSVDAFNQALFERESLMMGGEGE